MEDFYVIRRFIRIYTPFICAIVAIIHGIMFLQGKDSEFVCLLGDLTGHSIIVIVYIIATSKRMCRWYKYTCWLLLITHVINISYVIFDIDYYRILNAGIVTNFISVLTFLIYRIKVGITKILC
jgi:hypothetical protein